MIYLSNSFFYLNITKYNFGISVVIVIILILLSAFLSGSEVAIFGLTTAQKAKLKEDKNKNSERIINLLADPKKLLATILIGNNLVNVAIVIVSSFIINEIF